MLSTGRKFGVFLSKHLFHFGKIDTANSLFIVLAVRKEKCAKAVWNVFLLTQREGKEEKTGTTINHCRKVYWNINDTVPESFIFVHVSTALNKQWKGLVLIFVLKNLRTLAHEFPFKALQPLAIALLLTGRTILSLAKTQHS